MARRLGASLWRAISQVRNATIAEVSAQMVGDEIGGAGSFTDPFGTDGSRDIMRFFRGSVSLRPSGNAPVVVQRKPLSVAFGVQHKDRRIDMAAGPRSADTEIGRRMGWPKAGLCAPYRDGHKPTGAPRRLGPQATNARHGRSVVMCFFLLISSLSIVAKIAAAHYDGGPLLRQTTAFGFLSSVGSRSPN